MQPKNLKSVTPRVQTRLIDVERGQTERAWGEGCPVFSRQDRPSGGMHPFFLFLAKGVLQEDFLCIEKAPSMVVSFLILSLISCAWSQSYGQKLKLRSQKKMGTVLATNPRAGCISSLTCKLFRAGSLVSLILGQEQTC